MTDRTTVRCRECDADTWAMLLPDGESQHGKAIKNYHPANPRGDDGCPVSSFTAEEVPTA